MKAYLFLRGRACASTYSGEGQREGVRITSGFCAQCRAPPGSQSHDPAITTCAETKSPMPTRLCHGHPGASGVLRSSVVQFVASCLGWVLFTCCPLQGPAGRLGGYVLVAYYFLVHTQMRALSGMVGKVRWRLLADGAPFPGTAVALLSPVTCAHKGLLGTLLLLVSWSCPHAALMSMHVPTLWVLRLDSESSWWAVGALYLYSPRGSLHHRPFAFAAKSQRLLASCLPHSRVGFRWGSTKPWMEGLTLSFKSWHFQIFLVSSFTQVCFGFPDRGDFLVISCTNFWCNPTMLGEHTLKNLSFGPLTFVRLALWPSVWFALMDARQAVCGQIGLLTVIVRFYMFLLFFNLVYQLWER